jgi:ferredoxin-NADP reductase
MRTDYDMVPPITENQGVVSVTVLQRAEVSSSLQILRVTPHDGELSDCEVGQFAVLGLPFRPPRCRRLSRPS